ncbi:MAG: ABC transporter permease [Spirochaetes bacterium]|nr:MAG: ABC transporter permease [Spirochaetota bacterium]RKX98822.1 MAG: ABC transporter permease [Spirochaetota bacterium]
MQLAKKAFRHELTSVILPLVILFLALIVSSPGFLSAYNITSQLQSITIYMIIGLAQMTALSLGHLNLAIGSIGSLTSILMGYSMQEMGVPVLPALLIGLVVATICGFFQGLLITRSRISPFIISLALLSIYKGIGVVISRGVPFDGLPDAIKLFNRAKAGVVPVTFFVALATAIMVYIIFRYSKTGLRVEATGANPRAALYSGIQVKSTVVIGHSLSGLLCGIAAIIQTARFGSAQISVGDDWMLTSFVVAVLGGTLLSGGKASTVGAVLGSVLMVLINNALILWNVNTYMFPAILGIVLLSAYEVDRGRLNLIKRQSELEIDNEK